MGIADYLKELAVPARSASTLLAIITFYLLWKLILLAGLFGIWLLVMVAPAFFRYLVLLAQARARGVEADPPGIEYFSLVGNWWTLFPAVPVALLIWGGYLIGETYGDGAAGLYSVGVVAIAPAMMAVLIITQSPLQSLNPGAIATLFRECGSGYWWAPLTLLGLPFVSVLLGKVLPNWLQSLAILYLVFAFYAVTGAITRENKLIDEVYIDDPLEPDVDKQIANLEKERTIILNHAYGLVSRGNREGGLSHVYDWLQKDPDPDAAWPWFFEGMLRWETNENALFFAQRYLSRLLSGNDSIRANKIILRCRLVNETFRPLADDLPAAIEAAEQCANRELADALKRL